MAIKYPESYALGQDKIKNFPKVQYDKIKEIIDLLNDITDGNMTFDDLTITGTIDVAEDANITGALDVTGGSTLGGTTDLTGIVRLKQAAQTLTGAGAINTTTQTTLLVTTGTDALTLADGTDGQIKVIIMKTDGGDGTLTPANLNGGTTITFSAVGQTATLLFKDSKWNVIGLVGAILA